MAQHVTRTQPENQQISLSSSIARVLRNRNARIMIALWGVGLFLCFFASSPVTISESTQEKYNSYIPAVSKFRAEYSEARMRTYQAKGWFWWFSSDPHLAALQKEERRAYDKLYALQKKQASTVGLWSEYGIEETRDLMWRSFYSSTDMAKRMTYYDAFWVTLNSFGRRDEGIMEVLMQLLFRFVQNLVIGLVVGFFSFLVAVVGLIQRFSPNIFEGLIFFLLAALAIGSLIFTAIAGVCGCCIGTVYTVNKNAQRNLADRQARRQLHGQNRYRRRDW